MQSQLQDLKLAVLKLEKELDHPSVHLLSNLSSRQDAIESKFSRLRDETFETTQRAIREITREVAGARKNAVRMMQSQNTSGSVRVLFVFFLMLRDALIVFSTTAGPYWYTQLTLGQTSSESKGERKSRWCSRWTRVESEWVQQFRFSIHSGCHSHSHLIP